MVKDPSPGPPQVRDIALLGQGAPPEDRQCYALVSKSLEDQCTTLVIEALGRFVISDCLIGRTDITVVTGPYVLDLGKSLKT